MFPSNSEDIRFLVNFPMLWKFGLDTLAAGSGYRFKFEILEPGADVRSCDSLAKLVDVSLLPKAIGGDAFSVDEKTGEEDAMCCRGAKHETLSEFLKGLETNKEEQV